MRLEGDPLGLKQAVVPASSIGGIMPEQSVIATTTPTQTRWPRVVVQMLSAYFWFVGSLFLAAGRLDWVRGWIAVVLWIVGMSTIGLLSHHYNAGLLKERAKWRRKDTKGFDKVFLSVFVPFSLSQPAVCALDAARFHWSSMPFCSVYVGAIVFALAMVLIGWVMITNPYAETSIRIQSDRGQTVITSGPYRMVRHPMHAGSILMYLATPLLLGSVWALLMTAVITFLFIWRTANEDQTLRQELQGYEEFTTHTQYRLFPWLW